MNRVEKLCQKAIISKYRFIYHRIPDDKMSFPSTGFKHLIYHGRKKRQPKDIRHRMSFIPQIPTILSLCPEPIEIRGQKELHGDEIVPVCYYAYEADTSEGRIRLITRKIADEKPRFLSLIEIR